MRFIRKNPKLSFAALLAVVVAGGLIVAAQVQAGSHENDEDQDARIAVGTYNPGQAFESHPKRHELEETAQAAQAQMQQAQQAEDRQAMMRIQQEFQMNQQRIIQEFQNDVEKVMPTVVEAENVHVVAMEIVYARPEVETKDVTQAVIAELAQIVDEPEETELEAEPDMPWLE